MPLKIVRNDITKMNTEAIVNTANEEPEVGAGCDNAIYEAAGFSKLLEYRRTKIGAVPEGEVFITPGFDLAAKYIIHAVSPLYLGGTNEEENRLRSCYRKSLMLAKENDIASISFPLISTGSFGYPKEEGMRIAVDEINAFLMQNDMLVYLVVFDLKATELGKKIYPDLRSYIDDKFIDGRFTAENKLPYNENKANSEGDTSQTAMPRLYSSSPMRELREPQASRRDDEKAANKSAKSSKSALVVSRFITSIPVLQSQKAAEPNVCEDFEEFHESRLEERMRHLSDTYSEYLMYLIQSKGMENADVWKRAIVDKKIFSKIKNNADYHPNKLTALCLCMGAKLNLDETKDLLARAGYALSPCDKTDIIFSYFIENEIYDMIELDIQLEEYGLPCIIQ